MTIWQTYCLGLLFVRNQPSTVQYWLFDKHCDPRFQCLVFEGSEKILRSLVGESASRPLLVSLSLAHLAADLLGDQYNMRDKSVPTTRRDSVWFTTISYRTTFCGDWLIASLLANGVNCILMQDGLHWSKVSVTSYTKTQTLPEGSSVRHCYCFIYLKMFSPLYSNNYNWEPYAMEKIPIVSYGRSSQIFQNCRSHRKFLGTT